MRACVGVCWGCVFGVCVFEVVCMLGRVCVRVGKERMRGRHFILLLVERLFRYKTKGRH